MVLRIVIISVLLGATIFMNQDIDAISGASTRFLLAIIVFTYVLTIGYAIWYRTGKHLRALGYIQFTADAFLFSGLTYSTGGITSGFTFLFHLWVIVAVVSLGKRAGYILATVSSLLLCLIALLSELRIINTLSDISVPEMSLAVTLYATTVNVVSLYIVAALVNILAARLEFAGEGLQIERAQKEELAQKLEHAERLAALGELAATLAHEIRNPLSAVSGSFQMLQSGLSPNSDDNMLLEIIDRELLRMGRLVDDILEYARPRQPQLILLDVSKLCTEVLRSFQIGIQARGVEIVQQIDSNVHCYGDGNQLKQVLWNILVNASHVVPEDNGRIDVRVYHSDDDAVVEIEDNGPGVAPEIKERMFEAFFSTKERGMGLGLALSHRILTDHRGSVTLIDKPHSGAVFQLRIPGGN